MNYLHFIHTSLSHCRSRSWFSCTQPKIRHEHDRPKCFFLEVYWEQTGSDTTASNLTWVLTAMFALTARLGNGIVMLVIWKARELHSLTFTLPVCLAASDLTCLIISAVLLRSVPLLVEKVCCFLVDCIDRLPDYSLALKPNKRAKPSND